MKRVSEMSTEEYQAYEREATRLESACMSLRVRVCAVAEMVCEEHAAPASWAGESRELKRRLDGLTQIVADELAASAAYRAFLDAHSPGPAVGAA